MGKASKKKAEMTGVSAVVSSAKHAEKKFESKFGKVNKKMNAAEHVLSSAKNAEEVYERKFGKGAKTAVKNPVKTKARKHKAVMAATVQAGASSGQDEAERQDQEAGARFVGASAARLSSDAPRVPPLVAPTRAARRSEEAKAQC